MSYDVYKIRKDFPMLNGDIKMQGQPLIFLDNASTSFKPYKVIDAVNLYLTKMTCNAHRGDYDLSYNMDMEIENTRKAVASFVNCDKNEVIFTSGTTMSINLLAFGYGKRNLHEGDEIVLDESEHASNILPWYKLAKETGAVIRFIELDKEGRITLDNLKKVLNSCTKIVSLAAISNVLGFEIDLKEFAKEIHKVGAVFAVDGAQSVPHAKTDFKNNDIDFLSFSGHKMCGPTGIGCLIGKYSLLEKMDSFLSGGGMNITFNKKLVCEEANPPMKFEAGTQPLEQIMGLHAAIDYLMSIGIDEINRHEIELRKYAVSEMKKNPNVIIYNENAVGPISFNLKGIFAQDEASLLNSKGIAVRSGLHCAKMLVDFLGSTATLRASTYLYTTKEEIDLFVKALGEGDILDAFFN